jgi:hypothetical protein
MHEAMAYEYVKKINGAYEEMLKPRIEACSILNIQRAKPNDSVSI